MKTLTNKQKNEIFTTVAFLLVLAFAFIVSKVMFY